MTTAMLVIVFLPLGRSSAAMVPLEQVAARAAQEPSGARDPGAGIWSKAIGGGSSGAYKTCVDMYTACQDIGGDCTKGFPGCDKYGRTSCATCFKACKAGSQYPPECKCSSCGFTE